MGCGIGTEERKVKSLGQMDENKSEESVVSKKYSLFTIKEDVSDNEQSYKTSKKGTSGRVFVESLLVSCITIILKLFPGAIIISCFLKVNLNKVISLLGSTSLMILLALSTNSPIEFVNLLTSLLFSKFDLTTLPSGPVMIKITFFILRIASSISDIIMIQNYWKFFRFSTQKILTLGQVRNAVHFITNNPAQVYLPWIKQQDLIGDSIVYIIGFLRQQNRFEDIRNLVSIIDAASFKDMRKYLSLVTLVKKIEFSEEFSQNMVTLIDKFKDSLSAKEVSECFRALPHFNIRTVEKFRVIDLLFEKVVKRIDEFESYEKSYVVDGVFLLPCEKTTEIFRMIAKSEAPKSLREISSLCNFMSVHQDIEFSYLFDQFETKILEQKEDVFFFLNQAIHSFSKIGKGSEELYSYFVQMIVKNKHRFDDPSMGMVISNLIKHPGLTPKDFDLLKILYNERKNSLCKKHIKIITKYL